MELIANVCLQLTFIWFIDDGGKSWTDIDARHRVIAFILHTASTGRATSFHVHNDILNKYAILRLYAINQICEWIMREGSDRLLVSVDMMEPKTI